MEKYTFKGGFEGTFVSSRQNAHLIETAKLFDKKHRDRTGLFLCDGVKLALEAASFGILSEVFLSESRADYLEECAMVADKAGAAITVLADHAFEKLTDERSPQGIVSVVKQPEHRDICTGFAEGRFILLLDSVRDPGNLGTILRSAGALGNAAVVLYSCADLYNKKTVRAAMGALFKTDISVTDDPIGFIKGMKASGRRVLASSPASGGLILGGYETCSDDCIVIGNEGHGITDDIISACSDTVMIPMMENVESLNAAAAAATFLWEYARKGISADGRI